MQTKQQPQTAPEQTEIPTLLEFRRMFRTIRANTQRNSVLMRHYAQDMDMISKEWKKEADAYLLDNATSDKVTATDYDGVEYAVIRVDVSETVYNDTKAMRAAIKAVEDAKLHLKEVQKITPSVKQPKEEGTYYKVTNP